jgi:hypothetical protein
VLLEAPYVLCGKHSCRRRGDCVFQRDGMGREPSPTHDASEAELIEHLRLVTSDATSQNLGLPGIGGRFVTLELLQRLQRAAFTHKLRSRSDVLPAK